MAIFECFKIFVYDGNLDHSGDVNFLQSLFYVFTVQLLERMFA